MKISYKHTIPGASESSAPILTSGVSSATNITDTGATLNSTDTFADGGSPITETGVVVYLQGSDETDASVITVSGSFPIDVSGLTAHTNYCFKPYATNENGTTYGSEYCFETLYDPFIMTVSVTDPEQPKSIGYQAGTITSVDWGDGTVNTDTTHTYSSAGDYDISIKADGLHLKVGDGDIAVDIKQWGDVVRGSMEEMFKFSSISTWTATDAPALVGVTSMSQMFYRAESFNQPLNNRDTSSVTNMRSMFEQTDSFNQPLNDRDTSSVTNMQSMFDGANSFNQPLNDRDTSSVTNMFYMFYGANLFDQPLNNRDTSSVTNMYGMFSNARSFNQPLNDRDTSSVTNMQSMFDGANLFNQDITNWCVTNIGSKPTNFDRNSGFENQTALQPQWGTCP